MFATLLEALTYLFPIYPFLPPENIRKLYCFLMFSGGRERVHWKQMGQYRSAFRTLPIRFDKAFLQKQLTVFSC